MRRQRGRKWEPATWQKDPAVLKTDKVQVWTQSGTMLTAEMPLEEARRMVVEGKAYVITAQAIGRYW